MQKGPDRVTGASPILGRPTGTGFPAGPNGMPDPPAKSDTPA
jgi:hypothetical protein